MCVRIAIISQAHASAATPWHMFPSYVLRMIALLALVAATFPVKCSLVFSYVILSQAHASATKPWHMFPSYVLHMIVSLALVAATCPCKLFHHVILGYFVPGTCLCYNTLLHVLLVCIACDVVADTCRRNKSLHQNPSCLTTFKGNCCLS